MTLEELEKEYEQICTDIWAFECRYDSIYSQRHLVKELEQMKYKRLQIAKKIAKYNS